MIKNILYKKYYAIFALMFCVSSIFLLSVSGKPILKFIKTSLNNYYSLIVWVGVLALPIIALMNFNKINQNRIKICGAFIGYIILVILAGLLFLKAPAERVHFIEFGILGVLIWNYLSFYLNKMKLIISSVFLGTIVGGVDEVIQYFLPTRVGDWRDVLINAISCISGIIIISLIIDLNEISKNRSDANEFEK